MRHLKPDPLNLSAIDHEIAEIDERLEEHKRLVQRRSDLVNFKQLAQRLGFVENENGASPPPPVTTDKSTPGTTAGFAYNVLRITGSLTLNYLLAEMRKAGWTGSGNDAIDKKRIYAAIYNKEGFFERDGEKWRAKK